jgi:pyruvate ferredoxin oxidoreductase gamma subunit
MYRMRLHGRGGQGIKTASRILGTAFFDAGFEVQDAPVYGAERRGAPMFAYVRAARAPIRERGPVAHPDLVVVADETLIAIGAANVLQGYTEQTVLLIHGATDAATWRSRLAVAGPVIALPMRAETGAGELPFIGARCAGAAACLVGAITREQLAQALRDELAALGEALVAKNLDHALGAFDEVAQHSGCVREGGIASAKDFAAPQWVEVPSDSARIAAPDVFAVATSVEVRTGLWRTLRPEIDYDRCRRCNWVCSTLCPDSAIAVRADGAPQIDYDHCKGCMICVAVCPPHAISARPEREARAAEAAS